MDVSGGSNGGTPNETSSAGTGKCSCGATSPGPIETITIQIAPTTGGQFELQVAKNETIDNLKKLISKKLKVPKERICLLYRERQLREGNIHENNLVDGCKLTLLPSVETGLLAQRPEQSVMQALESLNDCQVNDFLSGKAPLNLTMRLGDHMMLIQLQLSTVTPSGSRRASAPSGSSASKSTFTATSPQPSTPRTASSAPTTPTSGTSLSSPVTPVLISPPSTATTPSTPSTPTTPSTPFTPPPSPPRTPSPPSTPPTPIIPFILTMPSTPNSLPVPAMPSVATPTASHVSTVPNATQCYPFSSTFFSSTHQPTSKHQPISSHHPPNHLPASNHLPTATHIPTTTHQTSSHHPASTHQPTLPHQPTSAHPSPSTQQIGSSPLHPTPDTCSNRVSSSDASSLTDSPASTPTPSASTTSTSTSTTSTSASSSSSSSCTCGGHRSTEHGQDCTCGDCSKLKPILDTKALAEASRNLTQTLKQLSSEVLTCKSDSSEESKSSAARRRQGAIIESMHHHGKGVYSGTFSGTLNPALQDRSGRPKRDISTIIHILNDLLCATPQYRRHARSATQALHTETSSSSSRNQQTVGDGKAKEFYLHPPKEAIRVRKLEQLNVARHAQSLHNNEECVRLNQENQATRGKIEQLKLIMEERRARRKARREARTAPYTSWCAKSETTSVKPQSVDCNNPDTMDMDTSDGNSEIHELNSEPVVA